MLQIVTSAFLPFPREQVWAVLSDFRRYSEWNPLNVSAEGEAVAGAKVPMTFIDPGHPGKTLRQTVHITAAEPCRTLEWVGSYPLLFTGRHFFDLHDREDGTQLTHGEAVSGLIPAFWSKHRVELQRQAYEACNTALARRLASLFKPS